MPVRLAPSSNFRNPLGLLGRMLLSGRRAAYAALAHEALRIVSRPLDALLQRRERRYLTPAATVSQPILLVVGAPRSGTTLVYQTLARYLDVSYFSNLTSLFPRSPISGTRMFRWLLRQRSADFRNFYGQTAGLAGPHDGFGIWNRWLGEDRYVPRTDLSDAELNTLREFFDSWTQAFPKPFLNKNNRNTSCLEQLSRALPAASFIVVRRNPLLVAQSLITAREQVQGDKHVGWGLLAHEQSDAADPLAYVDDVAQQVLQIEEELNQQLQNIPAGRIVELTYEGFCENPQAALRELVRAVPGLRLKESLVEQELRPFQISATLTLTPAEQTRLRQALQQGSSGVPAGPAALSAPR